MPYPELKPIEYDHEDDAQMDLYWASWVRGLTGVSTNELLTIKSLWRSGLIALRYSYLGEIDTGVNLTRGGDD